MEFNALITNVAVFYKGYIFIVDTFTIKKDTVKLQ